MDDCFESENDKSLLSILTLLTQDE